ncbi:replication protein A 70 kDa DNA-binding subunit C-like protein [Tanacetum coccineum]
MAGVHVLKAVNLTRAYTSNMYVGGRVRICSWKSAYVFLEGYSIKSTGSGGVKLLMSNSKSDATSAKESLAPEMFDGETRLKRFLPTSITWFPPGYLSSVEFDQGPVRLRHDRFMIEFDGETSARKVSANPHGFLRYPFRLLEFDQVEAAHNKYLIDIAGGQSLRTTTFHCKVMIGNFLTKKGWHYPSCGYEKCRKGASRKNGKWVCEACNRTIDYPVFRYRLEFVVADDTAHTVVVMFNETATELLKCSAESLMGTEDEGPDTDDGLNLPLAIRNLIGTTHVLEIKSHTYYEYGTFESFNCWKINPGETAADDASSSTPVATANDVVLSEKIVTNPPTVCTPLKTKEAMKQKGHELEDSDVDEVCGPFEEKGTSKAAVTVDIKKKRKRDLDQFRNSKVAVSLTEKIEEIRCSHEDQVIMWTGERRLVWMHMSLHPLHLMDQPQYERLLLAQSFLGYPFKLIDFDWIEPTNNKYLIGRGQSLRMMLWGGLGDVLIEKKTKHVVKCAVVLTSMSAKNYSNKLYLSSCSLTVIYDDETRKGWNYPSCGGDNCKKGATRQAGKFFCEACNQAIEYPVLRYRLELSAANDTAHVVVVVFDEPATGLLHCSAESLLETVDKVCLCPLFQPFSSVDTKLYLLSTDDDSGLPTAITNLIGTTHVLELKSHTYYEYGTFESFTCWKINPSAPIDEGACSSTVNAIADNPSPSFKRLSKPLSMSTPSKGAEENKKKRSELEDSDTDEVCGPSNEADGCKADDSKDKKKRLMTLTS